jgi:hypothetical protein
MEGDKVKRERWEYGIDPLTFWTFLDTTHEKKKKTYLFSHNIGHDLSTLDFWQLLEQGRYSLHYGLVKDESGRKQFVSSQSLADPPTIVDTIHSDSKARVVMVDVINYLQCGMDELSKTTNLPRITLEDDVDNLSLLVPKVKRDCRIIVETILALVRLWQREKLGNFKLTASGLAYEAYRARFMKHKLMVHGHKLALHIERGSYYGGMVDCRFIGQVGTAVWDREYQARSLIAIPMPRMHGQTYVLDINSMYPAVMRDYCFPTKLRSYRADCRDIFKDSRLDWKAVAAWVKLDTQNSTYPYRNRDRVTFCKGRFTTYLCGSELYNAIVKGHIIEVLCLCEYYMQPIFKEFVEYFWNKRQEARVKANGPMALFYKTIMNSLTGKWAQRLPRWVYHPEIMASKEWGSFYVWNEDRSRLCSARSVGGHTFRDTTRGEGSQSIPIISAFITAYARDRLRSLIEIAGRDNVYYYDTDSLHVSGSGYDALAAAGYVDEYQLGKLKIVGVYDYAEYRGVKDYTLDDSHTISGRKAESVISSEKSYTQMQRQRLMGLLSSKPNGTIIVSEVTKRVGLAHINGCVDRYGWVEPRELREF